MKNRLTNIAKDIRNSRKTKVFAIIAAVWVALIMGFVVASWTAAKPKPVVIVNPQFVHRSALAKCAQAPPQGCNQKSAGERECVEPCHTVSPASGHEQRAAKQFARYSGSGSGSGTERPDPSHSRFLGTSGSAIPGPLTNRYAGCTVSGNEPGAIRRLGFCGCFSLHS